MMVVAVLVPGAPGVPGEPGVPGDPACPEACTSHVSITNYLATHAVRLCLMSDKGVAVRQCLHRDMLSDCREEGALATHWAHCCTSTLQGL